MRIDLLPFERKYLELYPEACMVTDNRGEEYMAKDYDSALVLVKLLKVDITHLKVLGKQDVNPLEKKIIMQIDNADKDFCEVALTVVIEGQEQSIGSFTYFGNERETREMLRTLKLVTQPYERKIQ